MAKKSSLNLFTARAEAALLGALFRSVADFVFIKDTDARYRMINAAGASLLGLDPDRVAGATDEELFEGHCLRVMHETDELALTGETVAFEHPAAIRGKRYVLHTLKSPLTDSAGRVAGICGVSRDITDRRAAEDGLRRLARVQRAIVECSRLLFRAGPLPGLLGDIPRIIVERGGYIAARLSLLEDGSEEATFGCPGGQCPFDAPDILDEAMLAQRPFILTGGSSACRSVAAFPLLVEGAALGALVVCSREVDGFGREYEELFSHLAEHIAFALGRYL